MANRPSGTPIDPSVSRAVQTLRETIAGADNWFGPLQPLPPYAPESVKGRQWDYLTGYNLQVRPRPSEPLTYQNLRSMASGADIVRTLIETRKDQIDAQQWTIRPKEGRKNVSEAKIEEITQFFTCPDGQNEWHDWLRMLLEDLLVIDAPALYRHRTNGGDLLTLNILDGATITCKINGDGRRPKAPEVAFQQIIKGVPAVDYDETEILFLPRNLRSFTPYGFSPVEQIARTVKLLTSRQDMQLSYYKGGGIPLNLIEMAEGMTFVQLEAFQKSVDARLSGNFENQQRLMFVPAGTKPQPITVAPLVGEEEKFYTRIACFAFSISPEPFLDKMNRGNVDTAKEAAASEGLQPLLLWVKRLIDRVIREDFGVSDIEFSWNDTRELDPAIASTIRTREAEDGIISIDEARAEKGLDPLGGAFAIPQVKTAMGYVQILSPEEQDARACSHADAAADSQLGDAGNAANRGKTSEDDDKSQPTVGKRAPVKKKSLNPYMPSGHKH